MALKTREKAVINRFLRRYNEYHASAFAVSSWPDELNRTEQAIDAIAEDAGTRLGVEHTLLQPFSREKEDSHVFSQTVGQLDQKPTLVLENYDVDLNFKVGAIPKGFDWSLIAPAVEAWYLGKRDTIPEGQSQHHLCNLPIALDVSVHKTRSGATGHFFVQRLMPSESADVVLEQALATKLGKLVAAPVAKRVLLLEKASLVRGSSEIGDAVEALRSDFSDLAKIDEVWVIDTVALATENYTASYLVWPPAEAHNFEDWRHAVSST